MHTNRGVTTKGKWESRPRFTNDNRPTNKEADKNRLEYLKMLESQDQLPPECEAEMRYLQGHRKPRDFKFHKLACKEITRLNQYMLVKDIADYTEAPYGTLCKLTGSGFSEVADGYAKRIYYELKKVGIRDIDQRA